eukprot:12399337-Karenia_brevis.AAC.1
MHLRTHPCVAYRSTSVTNLFDPFCEQTIVHPNQSPAPPPLDDHCTAHYSNGDVDHDDDDYDDDGDDDKCQ